MTPTAEHLPKKPLFSDPRHQLAFNHSSRTRSWQTHHGFRAAQTTWVRNAKASHDGGFHAIYPFLVFCSHAISKRLARSSMVSQDRRSSIFSTPRMRGPAKHSTRVELMVIDAQSAY